MPPTRFDADTAATGFRSCHRLVFALAMMVGVTIAPAAFAQQSLGSFPNSRSDSPPRGASSGDVLPFVDSGSGTLRAPSPPSSEPSSFAPENGRLGTGQMTPTLGNTRGFSAPPNHSSKSTTTNKIPPAQNATPPASWTWTPPADAAGTARSTDGNVDLAADSQSSPNDGKVVFAAVESAESSPAANEATPTKEGDSAASQNPTQPETLNSSKSNGSAESAGGGLGSFSGGWIISWLEGHGPSLLAIFAGMAGLWFLAGLCSRRIVAVIARGGDQGPREERIARSKTLVGVFHNASSMVIVVAGILMVGQEVGIAVAPLLGGAAAIGLAAAFGAQNLIRDYFNGFMILLENQYRLNDIVAIDGVSGQVERITMRITVLRDLHGNVHFVPNGTITTVTNMSHGWSRSVIEIRIAYKEDTDRVMRVLMDLAGELRQDPDYAPMIIDDAEMLGVEDLADSSVNIKFVMKTRPLKQWAVRRELLRRIKRRFDELNIEIPYPHRTVLQQSAAPAHETNGRPLEHAEAAGYR